MHVGVKTPEGHAKPYLLILLGDVVPLLSEFDTSVATDATDTKQFGTVHQQVVHFVGNQLDLLCVLAPHGFLVELECTDLVQSIGGFGNRSEWPVK